MKIILVFLISFNIHAQAVSPGDSITASIFNQISQKITDFVDSFFPNRVCYVKDVKPMGTNAGGSTAGRQFRDLNVINEDGSDISSSCNFIELANNEMTIDAIKFKYECSAPAFRVNGHQVSFYNSTNQTITALGTTEYTSATADYAQSRSYVTGTIEHTQGTKYKLEHSIQSTRSTANSLGEPLNINKEVYSQCVFEKIK